jgi:Mn2+/Fe2+ NRAMP family transporter
LTEALYRSIIPQKIDTTAIVTLVGGTVGGYISFAGAHRLLDAGIKGKQQLPQVTRSSISAILLASVMRILLFLAALGIVMSGSKLNSSNPAASVFQIAAGNIGYKIFGVVLWSAAITSVIGSAYTSISFLKTFHPWLEKNYRLIITGFILFSTVIFSFVGKPVKVLLLAGALNGLILPLALLVILFASSNKKIIGSYKHPAWLYFPGWMVVATMAWMGIKSILTDLLSL